MQDVLSADRRWLSGQAIKNSTGRRHLCFHREYIHPKPFLPVYVTLPSRAIISCLLIPATSSRFWDDAAPDTILTEDEGTPSFPATRESTALFALPSTAGAGTRQPIARRHSLYPAGKTASFAPAVTSIAITVPCRSSERASELSGIIHRGKGMLPGNNAHGSRVACCRSSPVFKPLPGDCLSRNRVVPWIISRRLSIDLPGTYGCAYIGIHFIGLPII